MKLEAQGYCVAVVGAGSLLGKELLAVLEERKFPVRRLVTFESDEEEPDLPIVDLQEGSQPAILDEQIREEDLDFVFLSAAADSPSALPAFLQPGLGGARLASPRSNGNPMGGNAVAAAPAARYVVIDMADVSGGHGKSETPGRILRVPFLDPALPPDASAAEGRASSPNFIVSPHPAAILISSLLLRIAARFPFESAVAHVFGPASEIGAKGIEELQKQTVNLLSFQKIPRGVFGAQLAFNLLPRLGRVQGSALADLEAKVRHQLREMLPTSVPVAALRFFQVPVFYSLALSLYVETALPVAVEAIGDALEGRPIRLRRLSELAPSQVEATGSSDILVDAIVADADRSRGVWIWAVADNVRLAAVNAVEIAESLCKRLKGFARPRR